jgi:hypothetical protein
VVATDAFAVRIRENQQTSPLPPPPIELPPGEIYDILHVCIAKKRENSQFRKKVSEPLKSVLVEDRQTERVK